MNPSRSWLHITMTQTAPPTRVDGAADRYLVVDSETGSEGTDHLKQVIGINDPVFIDVLIRTG